MPKIQAATVADHRALQRRALVDAARELLEETGDGAAVTFATVARRTGLARNSVYKYFADRRELLAAVVADAVPRWLEAIGAAMAAADAPEEKVAAYVRAQLDVVRAGGHRVAQALAGDADAAALKGGAADAHRALLAPVEEALAALGEPDPRRAARLLQGVVNAAVTAVEAGDDPDAVTGLAVRAALSGFGPRA
ncbi:TetR/AcrR family transcriptional regulator [Actinomadura parmotrematis]|uniref:TetR/AcrR family transcriptional regulator n=1 Tax=Actinomadura parmotrematis TaxID=2864039 RepID=A0ABS7FQY8_9ACTN|nr:TetR/AcrR family transcriptional regulator [Actinomadura parmotrematis]MBW8482823.1 TetR/AcrR family transcriptional regulator [Actinomadura parmotrematis]